MHRGGSRPADGASVHALHTNVMLMRGPEMSVVSRDSAIETAPSEAPRAGAGVPPAAAGRPPPTVARPQSAVPRAMRRYLSLADFERVARRRLPRMLEGFVSGGAPHPTRRPHRPARAPP